MQLYKFQCGTDFGLTRDKAGKNLPPTGMEWTFVKEVPVHRADDAARIGVSYQDVTKGIADEGFFVWPVDNGASA